MPPSSSSVLLMAGSAALLAVAAYSKMSPAQDFELEDLVDESDCITPEDVCKIFDRLFLEMQSVVAQLSQQVQQIQMSGQTIPEKQLRHLLKGEFERALMQRQGPIFEEFDVDEDCLEEATFEFLEQEDQYPKVKRAVERFQALYENVSGESVVGKRRGGNMIEPEPVDILEPEKLMEAAEVYFASLTSTMEGIVNEAKDAGKDLNDRQVAQAVHMQFASMANDEGEKVLEARGITQRSFQASVEKHANNPEVARSLAMLQMQQQKDLMAMGVPAM